MLSYFYMIFNHFPLLNVLKIKKSVLLTQYALLSCEKSGLHQLDHCHLSSIATACAGTSHAGVATVALCILGSNLVEQKALLENGAEKAKQVHFSI